MAKLLDKLKKEIKKSKPKTKTITIKLREDELEALDIVSNATGKTKSEIIREALKEEKIFDEKTIEYFKSIQNVENDDEVNNESDDIANNYEDKVQY